MAANTAPIFPLTPKATWATITAANIAKDGTGVVNNICTAGANGAFVENIRAMSLGTNVATVLRIFLNNGASSAVAANNTLLYEKTLPATTLTEVAAQAEQVITLNRAIPAGYKLNAVLATAVAAGVAVAVTSGDY